VSTLAIGGPLHAIAAALGLTLLTVALLRLRAEDARARQVATAAGLLMAVPFSLGASIYPAYRLQIKPDLLVAHPQLAAAFESKEHLAAMGLCCVLGGAGAFLVPEGGRAGRSLLSTGWLLCVSAAAIGVVVTWWPALTTALASGW